MTSPVLQTVTYVDNNTIVLHFDRVVVAGDGYITISDGYLQSYYGSEGRAQRLVGATDVRSLVAGDDQITYGQDVTINLDSVLKSGLSYNVTLNGGAVQESDDGDFNGGVGLGKFSFTVGGTVSTPATPAAVVAATIHFTDTGTNAADYITAAQDQVVTGTYTGTLGTNDFVQVSLDNGASWHKATVNASAKTWSYSGEIDLDNLTDGAGDALNGALLARVSNVAGGSSAIASHSYVYNNSPITNIDLSSSFSFSADTGSSSHDLITKTSLQTISGYYEGTLLSGQTLQVSADGGTTWVSASASNGSWSSNTKVTLLSGTHEVQARVIDAAGNSSYVVSDEYKLITSTVALGGHALTLLSDFDTGVSHTDHITRSAEAVTLNVAGLHGFRAGDTIQILDTSNASAVVGSYVIQASDLYYGNDYFSVDQYNPNARTEVSINISQLSNGPHALAARVLDVAGNTSATASSSLSLTFDNVAPVLSTSAPVEDAGSVNTGITTLTFTFNENIAVEEGTQVTITDDNNPDNSQTITLSASAASGKILTITLTDALTAGTHYTVQGASISDLAGNYGITGDNPMLHFTTAGTYAGGGSPPEAPVLGYTDTAPAWDTDSNSALHNDGITNNNTFSVSGLDSNGIWYYRIGNGSWQLGSGDSFTLIDGSYAMDTIQVKQVVNGLESQVTAIVTDLEVDTIASAAVVVGEEFSAGAASISGALASSSDLPNEIVEVSFDHGATWVEASTTFIGTGVATWELSGISGQLTDNYALRLSDKAGNITGFAGQNGLNPAYYLADGGVTFHHNTENNQTVIGGDGVDSISLGSHAIVIGGDGDSVTAGAGSVVSVGDNATVIIGSSGGTAYITAGLNAYISGGGGAEIITLEGLTGSTVDGSSGTDRINLSNNTSVTLSSLSTFHGIDQLNFDSDGTNHLTILAASSVTSFSDNNRLVISNTGSGTPTITLDDGVWDEGATASGYTTYHNANSTVTVVIAVGISVDLTTLSG